MKKPELSSSSLKEKEATVINRLVEKRQNVFSRFPLLFTMLATFGLVATFYGFERLIDEVDILSDNPYILLGAGVSTLIVTGTLYKKLG